jgi:hypothetical protein
MNLTLSLSYVTPAFCSVTMQVVHTMLLLLHTSFTELNDFGLHRLDDRRYADRLLNHP